MRSKNLLIIITIIVLVVAICACAYMFFMPQTQYKNITVDGMTFEVKNSTANMTNTSDNYYTYNDTENNITILLFDSEGMGLNDFDEATEFAVTRDAMQMNNQPQEGNTTNYNYTPALNRYTYLTNYTHKNFFVVTQDKEDMEHILSTIKVDNGIESSTTEN